MLEDTDEARIFESMKEDLLRTHPGRYAVVCGHKLLGVYASVDDALLATCGVFSDGKLPAGAPILITEIARTVSVRVMATPSIRFGTLEGSRAPREGAPTAKPSTPHATGSPSARI